MKNGFSLIEVMITCSIIGILSLIAYPSYTQFLQKNRRMDAKTALLELAQKMEQYFMEKNSYEEANLNSIKSPLFSGERFYRLAITEVSKTHFKIRAIPIGPQAQDKCGTFQLNSAYERSASQENCW